jgi:hypothetical protein
MGCLYTITKSSHGIGKCSVKLWNKAKYLHQTKW